MPIYFQNPGEIDPHLITTLGVNVKEHDSPVGFFGTGLKYAIAVLLRENQEITIYSGLRRFDFHKVSKTLRGKKFDFIHMLEEAPDTPPQESPLGFTTELGKNWTLANAYRELYCNARDEGGDVVDFCTAAQHSTLVIVSGEAFEQIHLTRDEFLLNPKLKPLSSSNEFVQAFPFPSSQIFYRGIAAQKLERNSVLRYNLVGHHDLTEDRTLKYSFFTNNSISRFITNNLDDPVALHTILTTNCFERGLDLASWDCVWGKDFLAAVRTAIREAPLKVDDRITAKYFDQKLKEEDNIYTELTLSEEQKSQFSAATEFLCACGWPVTYYKIVPVESLGESILGQADRTTQTIRISALAFSRPEELIRTILEEYIHLAFKVDDGTRPMQDVLIGELQRVGTLLHKYQKKFGLSVTLDDEIPF